MVMSPSILLNLLTPVVSSGMGGQHNLGIYCRVLCAVSILFYLFLQSLPSVQ